jgi:chromosome segregation ATPase
MSDGTPLEQHEIPHEEAGAEQDPTVAGDTTVPGATAERLRLESALLEAEEELRERRLAMEVIRNELARTREDLDAERTHHRDDVERFREGLAHLRTSADEAIADERRATRELTARLGQAEDAIAHLQEQLESSEASLALAHTETGELRADLQRAREESAAVDDVLAGARGAAAEARADAERLLARLRTLGEGLG